MIVRLIGEDILVRTELASDLWPVKIDAGQVEQVLMNLVVNARDAMPTGGRLNIESWNVLQSSGSPHPDVPAGDWVVLSVSDTGVGMDDATCSRVFEPFFTTKGVGKGTGLGLATVYGIVTQSNGHINVNSKVGQGTIFTIDLPLAVDVSPAVARVFGPGSHAAGNGNRSCSSRTSRLCAPLIAAFWNRAATRSWRHPMEEKPSTSR